MPDVTFVTYSVSCVGLPMFIRVQQLFAVLHSECGCLFIIYNVKYNINPYPANVENRVSS